jgi:simple sugar transport system substrate-binding protein
MKKFIAVAFALAIASMAFASGNRQTPVTGETRGMDRVMVMGYAQIGAESEWRVACTNSVQSAAKEWNADLRFSDAQQKQENQIQAMRNFIRQGVDVIAFTPVVESGWEPVLTEAKAAGIPVILVDRTIDLGMDSDLFVTYIGSDLLQEGRNIGQWIVDYMNQNGRGNSAVNIVELQGTVGAGPAIDRAAGFREVIDPLPNFNIIRTQTGNFTRAEGKAVMEAFLRSDRDNIQVVYAHNDNMAIGAIQAIEESGLRPVVDMIVVSIDGVKGAFEAIMAGTLNATMECNPILGPQIMDAAVKLLAGETLPRWIKSDEQLFDSTNASAAFASRQY